MGHGGSTTVRNVGRGVAAAVVVDVDGASEGLADGGEEERGAGVGRVVGRRVAAAVGEEERVVGRGVAASEGVGAKSATKGRWEPSSS